MTVYLRINSRKLKVIKSGLDSSAYKSTELRIG